MRTMSQKCLASSLEGEQPDLPFLMRQSCAPTPHPNGCGVGPMTLLVVQLSPCALESPKTSFRQRTRFRLCGAERRFVPVGAHR